MSDLHHHTNITRHQSDPRASRVVPVSPNSRGVALVVNGEVYARYATAWEAEDAKRLFDDYWPAAAGVSVGGGK